MKTTNAIAYLLLYAANIDTEISAEEKEAIRSRLGSSEAWQQLYSEFEKDDEYTRLKKVEATLATHQAAEERDELITEVRKLMESDRDFSMMERYLLKLMGRY
jgi:uncharacterized tellurite resistance protein B-like protein